MFIVFRKDEKMRNSSCWV